MTASSPIPLDAFATELESFDSDAFAALVAETYAATADGVEVDGPRVTVSEGNRRTELLAVAAGDRGVPDVSDDPNFPVDAVVVASDSLDGLGSELDADRVTPADLRERLLYAVPPADANAIADRLLGVPVRSEAYDAAGSDAGTAESDAADDEGDGETDIDGDESGGDGAAAEDGAATGAVAAGVTDADTAPSPTDRTAGDSAGDSRTLDRPSDAAAGSAPSGEATATEAATADAPSDRRSPRTVLAAVAVVALLVAAAGAGFAAGTAGIGGLGGVAGVGDGGPTDPAATDSDGTGSTNGSDDGSEASTEDGDTGNTVSVADGDPTGEAERNTALSPTCERSALQVVQIQMNALRYNDNETNDGIRTLRAFASPRNKELVGSTGEYVELFETPLYAPMLTYDTAEYSVPEIADGAASVEVVTRENGSVTGRYEFRLVRVGGGTGESDSSLGDVDDCWMTDAVAASTE
ncbi:hypothetical protein [Halorubrum ruber]|uniref:Uncharacterized protein n=1 Tax=Halorubrum ruber TaxID=2982524 RepID=A0A8T8LME8_9EURY|nr:hypothetical protein [Halorubrum ruber]QUO47641.1 hypothetical protein J7656_13910 [Halorubrum ruber]